MTLSLTGQPGMVKGSYSSVGKKNGPMQTCLRRSPEFSLIPLLGRCQRPALTLHPFTGRLPRLDRQERQEPGQRRFGAFVLVRPFGRQTVAAAARLVIVERFA